MAVCQASVIAPLGPALAFVVPSPGNCVSMAAPPTNISLRVRAIGLTDLRLSSSMMSSLGDPRLSDGHCDLTLRRMVCGRAPHPNAQQVQLGQPFLCSSVSWWPRLQH